MIFYFSGTGNSLYVAKKIAQYNNERLVSIAEEMKGNAGKLEYCLNDDEIIGFVFPIYAWAPPRIVIDFIGKISFHNYKDNYIFSAATCGDEAGNTMNMLERTLKAKGLKLDSGFSIRMPNSYIITFDVDPKKLEKEKLLSAEDRIGTVNKIIEERKRDIFQVEKGNFPTFLTSVINPLFNTFGMGTKKFYATDACTGCGLCEKVCSVGNIKLAKKPLWGFECTKCLACIHSCPVKAIQYGRGTIKKGRYKNPNII